MELATHERMYITCGNLSKCGLHNDTQEAGAPFKLPDGRLVSVSSEEAAELAACMLQPLLAGSDCPSVAETAAASVFAQLDPAVRKVRQQRDLQVVCFQPGTRASRQ